MLYSYKLPCQQSDVTPYYYQKFDKEFEKGVMINYIHN